LLPLLDAHGLDASILVQARQTPSESDSLLGVAAQTPRIAGVVGWVDLSAPEVDREIERLAANERFIGVRHIVQDEPDDGFLLRPDFLNGVSKLDRHGLSYDILVFERQLPVAIEFARRFPDQRFVLDHIAKPRIAAGELSPWREHLGELARCPNVACKVSGLVTEGNWRGWKLADFGPYLDVVLQAFGPERLMYGSDWPVCNLAADYGRVYALADAFAAQLSLDERAGFFGGVAARWYQLGSGE
jgi:L-fuconolactonase